MVVPLYVNVLFERKNGEKVGDFKTPQHKIKKKNVEHVFSNHPIKIVQLPLLTSS